MSVHSRCYSYALVTHILVTKADSLQSRDVEDPEVKRIHILINSGFRIPPARFVSYMLMNRLYKMPSTNKSSFPPSLAATQTHDPFAVLSDLEITLVLSFLSVEETISIRRVSTLWKVTVDFRLSKAAIGRHFRGATEANAAYSNWEEEALAFRKLGM